MVSGAQPEVLDAVNAATGACASRRVEINKNSAAYRAILNGFLLWLADSFPGGISEGADRAGAPSCYWQIGYNTEENILPKLVF
jgi:hypothetical protein